MNLPDSGWLKALEYPWFISGAVFCASTSVYVLSGGGILSLRVLPEYIRAIAAIAAILALFLFIFGIANLATKRWFAWNAEKTALAKRKAYEVKVLSRLNTLSSEEERFLASLVESRQQSFVRSLNDPVIDMLRQKRLVARAPDPKDLSEFPHMIPRAHMVPDFVWWDLVSRYAKPHESGDRQSFAL
jgi:hypothetical protein